MPGEKFGSGDEFVLDIAKRTKLPCFLLLNKIDTLHKDRLLPLIAHYQELHGFAEVIPISALKKNGLDTLLEAIVKVLPEGPHYFPKDQVTDQPERFLVAELIREQVLQFTSQEVPHATTVLIDSYEEGAKLTQDCGDHLLRARGPEGHPDRQAGRQSEEDRHACPAGRSSAWWVLRFFWSCL